MSQWVALADKQIVELTEQKKQLEDTLAELKSLRDVTTQQLS